MPRPHGPSPKSVKRIYAILCKEPKSFEAIQRETELHRNTVGSTLKDLVNRGLLSWERKGHKAMYRMRKTEPPSSGWEFPWIALMMTDKEKDMQLKRAEKKTKKFLLTYELGKRVEDYMERIFEKLVLPPQNRELITALQEVKMTVTPRILLQNLRTPYCISCVRTGRQLCATVYDGETGEFVCQRCGQVLEGINLMTSSPPLVDEATKTSRNKRSEHYRSIEELLKKHGPRSKKT